MENKKFIVTIIILIIIIAGLGGFIAVDKLVLNKKEQEEKTTQVGDVEVNLTVFEHINDTLTLFNRAFNDSNSKFFGYLYTKREINTSNFDKSAAIYVSMYNNFITTNTPFIIPGGIVKTNFKNIFGKNVSYTPSSFEIGTNYAIAYDKSTDNYSYVYPTINNSYSPKFIEVTTKTSLESDKIVIKRKVFYVEYEIPADNFQVTKANIYTSNDKANLVKTVELKDNTINIDEIIGKYSSKFSTYTYTFKQTSSDRYDFYSIEKTK